jgi:hypothetical protein
MPLFDDDPIDLFPSATAGPDDYEHRATDALTDAYSDIAERLDLLAAAFRTLARELRRQR